MTTFRRSAIAVAPYPVIVTSPGFPTRLSSVCDDTLARWWATPCVMPELGPRIGFRQRFSNARAAKRLIDDLAAEIERLPESEPERSGWRDRVRERLQRFGEDRLGWPEGYRRLLFGDAFYESSVAFARDARLFDPRCTFEQLGQALRNVWIGNSFQMLLDLPVELRPGLFAYSMLYPVTDNWLDDPDVSDDRKRSFNDRFTTRLAGLPMSPTDERQEAVDRLVGRIEQEFPRGRFPGVYASLLAIQRAQSRSLDQHGGKDLTDCSSAPDQL